MTYIAGGGGSIAQRAPKLVRSEWSGHLTFSETDGMLVANPEVIRWGLVGAGSVCEVRCMELGDRRCKYIGVMFSSEHSYHWGVITSKHAQRQ